MAQDPDRFTVQILGVGSAEALRRYFDTHPFSDAIAYYRTVRGGKPWYVLLEGSYPDADAARAAIASFPPEIRRNQPWIRRIGDLQSAARP
jgi:DamX protein